MGIKLTTFAVVALMGYLLIQFSSSSDKASSNQVAFSAIRPSYWHLYEQGADGWTQLTEGKSLDYKPAFSPDGRYLVFTSEREGRAGLFVIDRSDPKQGPRRLVNSDHFVDSACISPDGKTLYFISCPNGSAQLFTLPFRPDTVVDLADATNLLPDLEGVFNPSVSPDGEWVVFSCNADQKPFPAAPVPPYNYRSTDIYRVRIDGLGLEKLTSGDDWYGDPCFSADGNAIYLYSTKEGYSRIYRLQLADGELRAISPDGLEALWPSTAGGRVLFSYSADGLWTIASVADDGTNFRDEYDGARNYWAPIIDPASGSIIAYGQGELLEEPYYSEPVGSPHHTKPQAEAPFHIESYPMDLAGENYDVVGISAFFPAWAPSGDHIYGLREFNVITRSRPEGEEMTDLYTATEGVIIGMQAYDDSLVFAEGIPFAPAGEGRVRLLRANWDGTNPQPVTDATSGNEAFPSVTPDGKVLVFRADYGGAHNIYRFDVETGAVTQLTFGDSIDTMPAVSPDGRLVAYTSRAKDQNYTIILLELNELGEVMDSRPLTNTNTAEVHPYFSSDGKWIFFSSERGGLMEETPLIPIFSPQPYGDIYALRLRDGHVVRITENKWEDSLPTCWHPPVNVSR